MTSPMPPKKIKTSSKPPVRARLRVSQWLGHLAVGLGWLAWLGLMTMGEHLSIGSVLHHTLFLGGGLFLLMLGCVFAVVHHADHLADMLREPYGTLVLTLSATAIEASLLMKVMLQGGDNPTLLRDTVFAVLMISMNAMVGLSITAGAWLHKEQGYNLRGAMLFVQLITPLSLLLLVMPNYTVSTEGPTFTLHQEAYLGALSVVVYLLFLWIQTGRHRSYFDHLHDATEPGQDHVHHPEHGGFSWPAVARSTAGLVFSLLPVVLLAEYLGHIINYAVEELRAPAALGGLVIASLGLFPEAIGGFRAAMANRLQRAVNICLGSALSTIGLTVPTVLICASYLNQQLILGLDGVDKTLLNATLLITVMTFLHGGTNMLQGIVHLMIFVGYIIFILVP